MALRKNGSTEVAVVCEVIQGVVVTITVILEGVRESRQDVRKSGSSEHLKIVRIRWCTAIAGGQGTTSAACKEDT